MPGPLERAVLLDVIQRCAWLIEYYERTGVAPESLLSFHATRDKAINALAALSPADAPTAHRDLQRPQSLVCPTSPTENA
jgi:hypothetical protein